MNNQSLAGSDRHISQGIGLNDTSGTPLASSSSLANGLNQSSTAQHIGQAGQATTYSAFSTDNTHVVAHNDGQGQITGLQGNSEASTTLQVTPRIAAATNAPTPGYPPTLTPYSPTPTAGSASASATSTSTPNATYLTYLHHFQQQQQASPSTPGLNPNVVGSSTPPSPAVYRSPSQPHTPPSSSSAGVKRKHEGNGSGSTSHLPKTVRKRRVKVNLGLIPATTSTSSSTLQPTLPSVQQTTTATSSFDLPARPEPEREEQGTYAAQQDLGGDGHPAEEGVEEPPSPQQTPQQQQQHEYRRDRPGAGGAKHWTDDEKTQLFVWMLSSDEHWQMFGSQMNTVFRNAATSLFEGRKSFTALKSCYHRNVETYKQIYAFEAFLTQTSDHNIPKPPHFPPPDGDYATTATNILYAPVPTTFTSSIHRETFLEQKLEAARTIGKVPVGNINVKVIDHWYRTGWHALFRRRYKADPPFGGTPVPYHGPLEGNPVISLYPPPPDMDPDVVQNLRDSVEDEHDHDEIGYAGADNEEFIHSTSSTSTSQKPPRVTSSSSTIDTGSPRRQTIKPPPQSSPALTQTNNNHLVYPPTASSQPQPSIQNLYHSSPSMQPPPPPQSSYIQLDPQTAQLLAQLSSTTQSLQTTCTTLTESLRIHHEESKQLQNRIKELEKKLDEQSAAANHTGGGGAGMDKKDKATLATEVLGNSNVGEHVKQAAADYLKRLFAAEF
ncbi:hypothetical protein ABKN59_011453 [Abortiporus biennis]